MAVPREPVFRRRLKTDSLFIQLADEKPFCFAMTDGMDGGYMKKVTVFFSSVILILACELAFVSGIVAQTMGKQPVHGTGSRTGNWSAESTPQLQAGSRNNVWLEGDEGQKEHLVGCYRLASDIEHHERLMRKPFFRNPVEWPAIRMQYADLKRSVQLLMAKHEEFVSELNNGQRAWWDARLRKITVSEFRLSARMGAIEGELKEKVPKADNVRSLLMELDVLFKDWKDCYSQMGADMNIGNLDQKSTSTIRGLSGVRNPER